MIVRYLIGFMIGFLLFFDSSLLCDNISIDQLLKKYEKAADLSNQTKKESAGFLIVYTRQDLDKMQVKTLKDIIDKIPFTRYNEDNLGFTSPFYFPYQPDTLNNIKVYINDKELVTPYNGNALRLFGQMSIGFIDHIEVYLGVPSQEFGIQSSWFTIKCYTKEPTREESDLVGVSLGSYGTKEFYGFSAKSLSDFSYMFYIDNKDLKRKKVYYNNNPLSKNKNLTNFYGLIKKSNFRFELQAGSASTDDFMGHSLNIDPKENSTDIDYFYTGIYYKDRDIRAYINYFQDRTDYVDSSKTILGFIPSPFYIYDTLHTKFREKVSDVAIFKSFEQKKNKLTIGLQGRYKSFHFKDFSLGSVNIKDTIKYNQEITLSFMAENRYQFDDSNLLTLSLKYDKKYENKEVKNYTQFSSRLGYIYHNKNWTSKNFLFVGTFAPSMETLYSNRVLYGNLDDPKVELDAGVATQLSYTTSSNTISLFLSHTFSKDTLYFNPNIRKYINIKRKIYLEGLSLRDIYNIDESNKIVFNYWGGIQHQGGTSLKNDVKYYGASLSLYNSYKKFDFYNEILYKYWPSIEHDGWNLNSTITYKYSRKLNFYIKGENILNKALKSKYISINPLTLPPTIHTLNNVDVMDRKFWFGVEYQF